MEQEKIKAIIILSGGLDSTTLTYDIINQKDIVLDELKYNIQVVKECLDFLDIDFDEFVKNV